MGASGILAATGTATAEVEYALLLVFYGVLGYWLAVSTRRRIGTTPWRLPPIIWAFVSAMLPLLGLVVEMVARFTTRHTGPSPTFTDHAPFGFRRRGSLDARSSGAAGPGASPVGPNPSGVFNRPYADNFEPPVPANPAGGSTPWPESVSLRPGPEGWTPVPPGAVNPSGPPPLFGWYADPDGRHEQRYWDGRLWGDLVRDGGVTSSAPLVQSPPTSAWAGTTAGAAPGRSEGVLDDAQGAPEHLGNVEADDSRPES
jgi:hypothetical protein